MDNQQIWELLQCCHLASRGDDLSSLIEEGFNPELAKMGCQLCEYLKSKELENVV